MILVWLSPFNTKWIISHQKYRQLVDTLKQVSKLQSSQVPGASSSQFSSSGNFKFRNSKISEKIY